MLKNLNYRVIEFMTNCHYLFLEWSLISTKCFLL